MYSKKYFPKNPFKMFIFWLNLRMTSPPFHPVIQKCARYVPHFSVLPHISWERAGEHPPAHNPTTHWGFGGGCPPVLPRPLLTTTQILWKIFPSSYFSISTHLHWLSVQPAQTHTGTKHPSAPSARSVFFIKRSSKMEQAHHCQEVR